MNITLFFITCLVFIAYLDATAIFYAIKAESFSRGQLISQALIVIFIPIVGAILILCFALSQIEPKAPPSTEMTKPGKLLNLFFLSFIFSKAFRYSASNDNGYDASTCDDISDCSGDGE